MVVAKVVVAWVPAATRAGEMVVAAWVPAATMAEVALEAGLEAAQEAAGRAEEASDCTQCPLYNNHYHTCTLPPHP